MYCSVLLVPSKGFSVLIFTVIFNLVFKFDRRWRHMLPLFYLGTLDGYHDFNL
jgi:hypothetical protein